MKKNYKHLATNLAIATDGLPAQEVIDILKWLEEKKLLNIEGKELKEVFEKQEGKKEEVD